MRVHYIHHRTHYHYPNWVVDSASQVKLYPLQDEHQHVVEHQLVVSEDPTIHRFQDYFDNTTGFFTLVKPHRELSIESFCKVEMKENAVRPDQSAAVAWTELRSSQLQTKWHDYLFAESTLHQSSIEEATHLNSSEHPFDELHRLSEYIFKNFEYKKGVTTIETGIDEIWKLRAGVCQDFAHLLLYMMRLRGVPCRYVSGYICPGNSEWRGEGATHAWAEAWLPDVGWVGIDPTNNCLAGERHVRLTVGRSFLDCTPVKGTYKGSIEHLLEVTVQFSSRAFTEVQLAPKEITTEQKLHFKKGISETYEIYKQRQQQQQ
jgi:transglutaminase-like putative cysteine protease